MESPTPSSSSSPPSEILEWPLYLLNNRGNKSRNSRTFGNWEDNQSLLVILAFKDEYPQFWLFNAQKPTVLALMRAWNLAKNSSDKVMREFLWIFLEHTVSKEDDFAKHSSREAQMIWADYIIRVSLDRSARIWPLDSPSNRGYDQVLYIPWVGPKSPALK